MTIANMVDAASTAGSGKLNSSDPARERELEERIRLQDRIIDLLNEQLRECRERLDGHDRNLSEAYQRLQLATDLGTLRESELRAQSEQEVTVLTSALDELRKEIERVQREAAFATAQGEHELTVLKSALDERSREIEALRRTWSWRLTKPLRLFAFGAGSPRR